MNRIKRLAIAAALVVPSVGAVGAATGTWAPTSAFAICVGPNVTAESVVILPSGQAQLVLTFQDTLVPGNGPIVGVSSVVSNGTVTIDPTTPLGGEPVTVLVTQNDVTQSTGGSVTATNSAGCSTTTDPAAAHLKANAGATIASGLAQNESHVTVFNGNPGTSVVLLSVNGKTFAVAGLKDGQSRSIDIASAMHAGSNSVSMQAFGRGGSATVLISQ